WERVCWERAAVSLKPLAIAGTGPEKSLAAYYAGLSLFTLGALPAATKLLDGTMLASLGPELQPTARLLVAASSWKEHPPSAADLAPLWDATRGRPEAVLVWEELARSDVSRAEPFATKLDARLRELIVSEAEAASGAVVGKWGLARLRRGDDP